MVWPVPDCDPPSEVVTRDVVAEVRNVADRIAHCGGGKVARIRIEVEFASGDEIAFEKNP
jgi:hypothetical protein